MNVDRNTVEAPVKRTSVQQRGREHKIAPAFSFGQFGQVEEQPFGNKFFSHVFSYLIDQRVKDTLCGTKVLRRSDYERLAAQRSYFGDFDPFGDFDLLFGASKLGLRILDLPGVERWLNVCWFDHPEGRNCSRCPKCRRTMLTLEVVGELERFSGAFDLEIWQRDRSVYLKQLYGPRVGAFEREIVELARERG